MTLCGLLFSSTPWARSGLPGEWRFFVRAAGALVSVDAGAVLLWGQRDTAQRPLMVNLSLVLTQ